MKVNLWDRLAMALVFTSLSLAGGTGMAADGPQNPRKKSKSARSLKSSNNEKKNSSKSGFKENRSKIRSKSSSASSSNSSS